MKNADLPAMPNNNPETYPVPCAINYGAGLTKREMFAMHIMANTCYDATDSNQPKYYRYAAESAVALADALLSELEKCKQ